MKRFYNLGSVVTLESQRSLKLESQRSREYCEQIFVFLTFRTVRVSVTQINRVEKEHKTRGYNDLSRNETSTATMRVRHLYCQLFGRLKVMTIQSRSLPSLFRCVHEFLLHWQRALGLYGRFFETLRGGNLGLRVINTAIKLVEHIVK